MMLTLVSWGIAILAFYISFYTITLLRNISKYFKQKAAIAEQEFLEKEYRNHKIKETGISLDSPERVNLTNDLLDIIVFLIRIEISNLMKSYQALGQTYQSIKLDSDVKEISQNVFNSLKINAITDSNLLLNEEFFLTFITKQSTVLLLETVKNYNSSFQI